MARQHNHTARLPSNSPRFAPHEVVEINVEAEGWVIGGIIAAVALVAPATYRAWYRSIDGYQREGYFSENQIRPMNN